LNNKEPLHMSTTSRHDGFDRREVLKSLAAGGIGALASSNLAGSGLAQAQTATPVRFVQQKGLLYLPLDLMLTGGILQKEADKASAGKLDGTTQQVNGPSAVTDALLSGAADFGTIALPGLINMWEKTRGTPNEFRAVGTMSNGPMTLYTINPNVKSIADFTDADRIAIPTIKTSFNAIMLQMAAEKLWGEAGAEKLDHLTVQMGPPDSIAAISSGFGKAPITAHIGTEPFTSRGLKTPGARVLLDSHEVFGGFLTQICLVATRRFKEANPAAFKAVGAALEESIKVANADKRAAVTLWKDVQKTSESVDELLAFITDPRFAYTSEPQRIQHLTAFLRRRGRLKAPIESWKDVFWETAYGQKGT
jgi:NitT/TauT family transport system substrate-binding protein